MKFCKRKLILGLGLCLLSLSGCYRVFRVDVGTWQVGMTLAELKLVVDPSGCPFGKVYEFSDGWERYEMDCLDDIMVIGGTGRIRITFWFKDDKLYEWSEYWYSKYHMSAY